jgi:hypothetical protein
MWYQVVSRSMSVVLCAMAGHYCWMVLTVIAFMNINIVMNLLVNSSVYEGWVMVSWVFIGGVGASGYSGGYLHVRVVDFVRLSVMNKVVRSRGRMMHWSSMDCL